MTIKDWTSLVLWIGLLFGVLVVAAGTADAADPRGRDFGYQPPDVQAWYGSLKQPDYPRTSCCGEPDAYEADIVEACRPTDPPDCALVAVVTDTRPDEPRKRPHVAPGTRIPVPRAKVRRPPSANPTDHNIVFISVLEFGVNVFCWEPTAGI